jgi:uncharacterized protein YndB with AHSA1/START domain
MANKTQSGFLVIGDITGYTNYVAQTELEHSQEILSELLGLILNQFAPLLKLAKLEGDAVFAYAPDEEVVRGESILEVIEATYIAFRDRVSGIQLKTTCTCNACMALPNLDLKFMGHHGKFIIQDIAGIKEMVGNDINLVHRLTKNSVREKQGWPAYVLLTQDALDAMGITGDTMEPHIETYEHVGEIEAYVMDMHERFNAITAGYRMKIEQSEAVCVIRQPINAPPSLVWAYLFDTAKRNLYLPGGEWIAAGRPIGRLGTGASNHCAHGEGQLLIENMLDFKPPHFYSSEIYNRGEEDMPHYLNFILNPLNDGRQTEVMCLVWVNKEKMSSDMLAMMAPELLQNYTLFFSNLSDLLDKEFDPTGIEMLSLQELESHVALRGQLADSL